MYIDAFIELHPALYYSCSYSSYFITIVYASCDHHFTSNQEN